MQLQRRSVLLSVPMLALTAGCLADDEIEDENGETDMDDGNGDDQVDASDDHTTMVTVADHDDLGQILVDGDGMTLYMFDSDEQGADASTCTGGCAESWPPVVVESDEDRMSDDTVAAALSTFGRDDGDLQVAANGWPLYYWANDESPGDATGQGVNDVWWVLDSDGEPIREVDDVADDDDADGADGTGDDDVADDDDADGADGAGDDDVADDDDADGDYGYS